MAKESKKAGKSKAEKKADEALAEQGGVIPPEDHVVDPANTGPATSHPEAAPSGGFSPDTAVPDRQEKDRRAGK